MLGSIPTSYYTAYMKYYKCPEWQFEHIINYDMYLEFKKKDFLVMYWNSYIYEITVLSCMEYFKNHYENNHS